MRTSIDYGIDLGTTNSAIARQVSGRSEIILGPSGRATLPSAVHVEPGGAVIVGEAARAKFASDPATSSIEFKRLMGTEERKTFASGKSMSPEELSAEVLRELLRWAERSAGERPRAAVITVPAMFQLPQCEATRRAAELAGIAHAPLLQEPIAAAIAHSGAHEAREGYWLVYDLGGGTFDTSLVRARDGRLQVLDHDGNNHLGGRDFDRLIVQKAADLVRAGKALGAFRRSDPAHADAFAKLKAEAERVRISLSTKEQEEFRVVELGAGEGGQPVEARFVMDRGELESLLDPVVRRTTALCMKLLSRNRLAPTELRGVVLVGGPTFTPCVAGAIRRDLGIDARHEVDPMHIVAVGAALFASAQKLPPELARARAGGAASAALLQLEYEPMTTDPAPLLAGRLEGGARDGASVRVTRRSGGFDSGAVPLDRKGAFAVELSVDPGALNVFQIELRDREQRPIDAQPSEISILHGFSVARPPLSQSVGVMLADNSVCWYLRRGAVLPARNTMRHATTVALRRGQSGEAISVPLIQGESARADRNKVIGILRIYAENIRRDLPAGTEVHVTLMVDESSCTTGKAYVPLLDQWFDNVVLCRMESKEAGAVRGALLEQKDRLANLERLAQQLEALKGGDVDARVAEIESLIEEGDRDSIDIADQMVRVMSAQVDDAEEQSGEQALVRGFEESFQRAAEVLEALGDGGEKRQLVALRAEFGAAVSAGEVELAASKADEVNDLGRRVSMRSPGFWAAVANHLVERLREAGLAGVAKERIADAQRALAGHSIQAMAEACRGLLGLLPSNQREGVDVAAIVSHVR